MRNPHQLARLLVSFTRMTMNVGQLERVLEISDALNQLGSADDTHRLIADFRSTPAGAAALRSRPRLLLHAEALAALPAESLGGAYARFMQERGLSPASLPSLQVRSDAEYVLAHLYETHDLWHVVTGFGSDLRGEIALQAFYLAQHRAYLPFFALSAVLLNTAAFAYDEKEQRLDAIVEGWLLGKRAQRLVGIDWSAKLTQPLVEVRQELGLVGERVTPPPGGSHEHG
ncbi:MAG: hypothetical protein JWN48_550 [Myxococcaceae bacterium]|nr:hypothetical protein [Myxococcaceae bacterium]